MASIFLLFYLLSNLHGIAISLWMIRELTSQINNQKIHDTKQRLVSYDQDGRGRIIFRSFFLWSIRGHVDIVGDNDPLSEAG